MQKITILAFVAIIFLCTSCASLLGPKEQDKYMKGMMLNDAERIIKEQLEPKKKPFEKTKDFEARVETSFKNASRLEFTLESIHQPKFGSRYAAKYGSKCELELKYSKSSVLSFRKDYYDADSEEWIVPLCNVLNIVQSGEKFETIRCNDAYSDTDTSVGFLVSNKRNSSALLKLIDKPGDAFYREDNKIYARIYEPIWEVKKRKDRCSEILVYLILAIDTDEVAFYKENESNSWEIFRGEKRGSGEGFGRIGGLGRQEPAFRPMNMSTMPMLFRGIYLVKDNKTVGSMRVKIDSLQK